MSTRDLKHPWKLSVWIIRIGAIVLGSWLLQGIRICVKEPYFTIFCGKLCRIGQDHAEPGEKQDHSSGTVVQQGPVLVETFFMVAEEYLSSTAAPGTWALMSPAQGHPGCRSWSPWSRRWTWKPEKSEDAQNGEPLQDMG